MKVGTVFFVTALALALIGSVAGASYHYVKNVEAIERCVYSHLETAAQSRAHHIVDVLDEWKEKIELIATQQELDSDELNYFLEINDAFYEVFVVDSGGKVVSSSDISNIGLDLGYQDYFVEGKQGTYVKDAYFSEDTQRESIAISTPFQGGVLVARVEMSFFERILSDKTGLGETGEIYLINREGYAITSLDKMEDTFLKFKVDSLNSRACLEDYDSFDETGVLDHVGSEEVFLFLDYAGDEVLGRHSFIPEKKWCLLAEISEDEVLGSLRREFQRTVLTIIIVLTLFVSIVAYFVGRRLDSFFVHRKIRRKL